MHGNVNRAGCSSPQRVQFVESRCRLDKWKRGLAARRRNAFKGPGASQGAGVETDTWERAAVRNLLREQCMKLTSEETRVDISFDRRQRSLAQQKYDASLATATTITAAATAILTNGMACATRSCYSLGDIGQCNGL